MDTALSSWTSSPRSPSPVDLPTSRVPASAHHSSNLAAAPESLLPASAGRVRKPRLEHGSRGAGLLLAVALHALALAALLSYAPARKAILAASPITVSLITEPRLVEPPKPVPQPRPRQVPLERRMKPPAPVAPAELPRIEPPAPPAAPVQAAPAPDAVHLPPADAPPVAAAPAAAPPPPLPIVPPVFNAAYLDNPAPSYPPLARRAHEEGKVLLRVLVSAGGTADAAEIKTSSGSARLDAAALETVKRWRFVAARQGDHAVPAWVVIPIIFSLES